jgi:hypothetical protein
LFIQAAEADVLNATDPRAAPAMATASRSGLSTLQSAT